MSDVQNGRIIKGGAPDVGTLHQALIEAGYSVASDELQLESFGPSTTSAVIAFQAISGLTPDGVVGPKTWSLLSLNAGGSEYVAKGWRHGLTNPAKGVEAVVKAAIGEIGVFESPAGSNSSKRIDEYQAPSKGLPWCAFFISWCYRQSTPPSPFGRIGSAWGIYEWGKKRGKLVTNPQPGDIAIIRRAGGRGHVALVVDRLPDGRLCTVGGNEGNAVRGKVRNLTDFSDYVRPL